MRAWEGISTAQGASARVGREGRWAPGLRDRWRTGSGARRRADRERVLDREGDGG